VAEKLIESRTLVIVTGIKKAVDVRKQRTSVMNTVFSNDVFKQNVIRVATAERTHIITLSPQYRFWHVPLNCQLMHTPANSAFYPFGVGKLVIHVITWITGVEHLNGRELRVWLFVWKAASPCMRA